MWKNQQPVIPLFWCQSLTPETVRLRLEPPTKTQKNRPKVVYDPSPEIFSKALKSSKKFGKRAGATQDKCLVAGRRAGFWGLRIGDKEKERPHKNIFFQDRSHLAGDVPDLTP